MTSPVPIIALHSVAKKTPIDPLLAALLAFAIIKIRAEHVLAYTRRVIPCHWIMFQVILRNERNERVSVPACHISLFLASKGSVCHTGVFKEKHK
jgi:hypothetical protein